MIEMWMYGASDHFHELDERAPAPLKELAALARLAVDRLHRAYRLGLSDGRGDYLGGRGLDLILIAVQSEEHLEGFLETVEQRLERQLEEERARLRQL